MRFILFLLVLFVGCTTSNRQMKDVALANYRHLPPTAHGSAFKMEYKSKDYIITAEHVCSKNGAILVNGQLAKVLFIDKGRDFCVLDGEEVKGMNKLPYSLSKLRSGQKIQVVGYPLGHIYSPSISDGRVIGLDFWTIMYEDGIRTIRVFTVNAPSYPGNSGGPVLRDGRVVGVLVAAEGRTSFGGVIPIRSVIKSMKRRGL